MQPRPMAGAARSPSLRASMRRTLRPARASSRAGYRLVMAREPLIDGHGRRIGDLRVSVTDRCNFRCQYCMPADGLEWLAREEVLGFEEIERLAGLLVQMGVEDVRLTGGEPLVRRDFPRLAGMLASLPGLRELALTTNGYLLERDASALADAG